MSIIQLLKLYLDTAISFSFSLRLSKIQSHLFICKHNLHIFASSVNRNSHSSPPPKKKQKTRPITMLRHTQGQKLAVTSHNSSQLETNTVWIWAVSNTSDHKMKSSWQASAFLQCLKTFRQHVILNCQAWELKRSWLMKDPQLQRCPVSKRKPKFS